MTAIFADTFYWTALTSTGDKAHRWALELSHSLQPDRIVTTVDVLVEYLAYFSSARPNVRQKAGATVALGIGQRLEVMLVARNAPYIFGRTSSFPDFAARVSG